MKRDTTIKDTPLLPSLAGIGSVYFIGIGGIGMSALARYFHAKGASVSGYDKAETALTRQLVAEGIAVTYEDDANAIPKKVDLVVYTPAIPKEHAGLRYYGENGFRVVKRSDVLQAISSDSFNICIAGTHGKTTITTMVAHILRHSGYGCNAFLGGIATNYGTNFWSSTNDVCVIEADEYDRSFLKLSPDVAVITSMDADHLDIYGDSQSMEDAFVGFGNKVKDGGMLLARFGLKRMREIDVKQKLSYSIGNDAADAYATGLTIEDGGYTFHVHTPTKLIEGVRLNMGGMHNVENMVAAITVATHLGIDPAKIRAAVAAFKGVKRRFEYRIQEVVDRPEGSYTYPVMIDDYAHHPEELKALLKSARSLFPGRKITVIFQPHLFTRTRDFQEEFASSLDLADAVVLLPIYPARELPIEGVTSQLLADDLDKDKVKLVSKEGLLQWAETYAKSIDKEFGEVIITAGAGDIDALVQPLQNLFEKA